MLTKNEITTLNLSPTKKDFVQIWNELLEVAGKLSERWDPTSTNESDPGIVILKALTGIADKLNYNIDKNTLEAFMPTAAQEDSMRKLCDMLGYNIKYFQSAKTTVTIKYYNPNPSEAEANIMNTTGLLIPKFTTITNSDRDVSYFTINQVPCYISAMSPSTTIECLEGQIVKCESINDNYVITANQISENNRFYLPEVQIAENGIFVYNVYSDNGTLEDGDRWEKVDNLNIQVRGSKVFKFGYDSYESRPYIEFPEDYSKLFNSGLFIYYARTNGINGNVSPRTLTQLEVPSLPGWSDVHADSFSAENVFSATTGANIETIGQAYNNFKKTIGTFDTLVTCRDYMNKIYSMTDSMNKPYVSNILVTDIRNDLNKAITICSCDDAGIFFKEQPLVTTRVKNTFAKPVFNESTCTWQFGTPGVTLDPSQFISDYNPNSSTFNPSADGTLEVVSGYWTIEQDGKRYPTLIPAIVEDEPLIDHFDLVFYPFKTYNQVRSNVKNIRAVYDASFNYTETGFDEIKARLEDVDKVKTIAHNIVRPREGDVLSINNYLRLNAFISTTSKLTVEEGAIIIDKIKVALANAFNMRELDFGEEIPFDSILSVIEKADSRIRVASLAEPALYTTFSVLDSYTNNTPKIVEYAVASSWLTEEEAKATGRFTGRADSTSPEDPLYYFNSDVAKQIYNKLALRNILAGRLPLFKYNTTFKTNFSEGPYLVTSIREAEKVTESDNSCKITVDGDEIHTEQVVDNVKITSTTCRPYADSVKTISDGADPINNISTTCTIEADQDNIIKDITLKPGEFVKFRAKNFITTKTYPAYVNYRLDLGKTSLVEAKGATGKSLFTLLNQKVPNEELYGWEKLWSFFNENNSRKKYIRSIGLSQNMPGYTETGVTSDDDSCTSENGQHNFVQNPDDHSIYCTHCGKKRLSFILQGPVVISISNSTTETEKTESLTDLLNQSGCLKLLNDYNSEVGAYKVETIYADGEPADLPIYLDLDSPFITSANTLNEIQSSINNKITELKDMKTVDGKPVLPTTDWTIKLSFECIPFSVASMPEWEKFVSTNPKDLFGFEPKTENQTVFWRLYGEGYALGKYINEDKNGNHEKFLKFDEQHFSNLPESILTGIYLLESLGVNEEPNVIKNGESYALAENEYLYIEYTPASVSTDSSSSEATSVTEIYGKGTIIRPSGFEVGLIDSDLNSGSPYKTALFNGQEMELYRFGATEQLEIQEFAQVELSAGSSAIYIYKNFNDCDELENANSSSSRKYTLKDGEYIFYTDKNKSELAYFTTGTEVILSGNATIPKCEVIEIATILDSGIDEIPWKYLLLGTSNSGVDDTIILQEYQYVTLGSGDTIGQIQLANNCSKISSDKWSECSAATYYAAADPEHAVELPTLKIPDCCWEVSSIFELDVSPNSAQTLWIDNNTSTSLTLGGYSSGGAGVLGANYTPKSIEISDIVKANIPEKLLPEVTFYPLSFKTNLLCQANGNEITINDIYSNPSNLKSFEVKLFSLEAPSIVKTVAGRVVPFEPNGLFDFASWHGENISAKGQLELWSQVGLNSITTGQDYDNALKLSVSIPDETYGVACFYVQYTSNEVDGAETWIEVIPGTSQHDITLLNAPVNWESGNFDDNLPDKLKLNPGINCVRINKTCTFFVKTSDAAQGSLFFDDLQLVEIKQETYVADGETVVKAATNGLNLDQLNYLQLNNTYYEVDTDVVNQELLNYSNHALEHIINDVEGEAKQYGASVVETIVSQATQIDENIKKAEEIKLAVEQTYETLADEDLAALRASYTNICTILQAEATLLDSISDIETASQLEQQLWGIIDNVGTPISSEDKARLLKELEAIKANIVAYTADIPTSEAEIEVAFNDFKEAISITKTATQAEKDFAIEVATKAKNSVEAVSKLKFDELAEELTALADSNSRAQINEALSSIYEEKLAGDNAQITLYINELKSLVSQETLKNFAIELEEAIDLTDYSRLLQVLIRLKAELSTDRLTLIVNELSSLTVNVQSRPEIRELVNDLSEAVSNSSEEIAGTSNSLTTKVNGLIDKVKTALVNESVLQSEDSTAEQKKAAAKALETCKKSITSELFDLSGNSELTKPGSGLIEILNKDFLANIKALVDKLDHELAAQSQQDQLVNIKKVITQLDTVEESEVLAIASKISKILNSKARLPQLFDTYLNGVTSNSDKLPSMISALTSNTSSDSYLIPDIAAHIWPALIKTKQLKAVEAVENALISDAWEDMESIVNKYSSLVITESFKEITAKLLLLAGTDAIDARESLGSYIKDIEEAIDMDSQLAKAFTTFKNVVDGEDNPEQTNPKQTIIKLIELIEGLEIKTEMTPEQKQQAKTELLQKLVDELHGATELDEQLLKIIKTRLLYKVWTVKDTLSADNPLIAFIEKIEAYLCTKEYPENEEASEETKDECALINDWITAVISYYDYLSDIIRSSNNNNIDYSKHWLEEFIDTMVKLCEHLFIISSIDLDPIKMALTLLNDLTPLIEKKDSINKANDKESLLAILQEILNYNFESDRVPQLLENFIKSIDDISEQLIAKQDSLSDIERIVRLEKQLLADLRAIDINRDFYYSAPIEPSVAISFNESNSKLNTLMNPMINYDINNMNNSFVISKLDIDYLDSGIQLARSSRLN